MKKFKHFLLTAAAVFCSTLTTWAAITLKEPALNADGYYQISEAAELYWFANHVNSGNTTANGVLTANIVINNNVLTAEGELNGDGSNFEPWTPIGTYENQYQYGTFDGNGYTISGLYFDNTTPEGGNYVGLIGYANNSATIKNVGVINSYIRGHQFVGGICGSGSRTNITNCYNTGTVTVSGASDISDFVGGICGYGYGGTQINCHNTGTVSGSGSEVGGICGNQGAQTDCYNTGTVSGSGNYVGGICGNQGTQTNCYNIGTVSGSGDVGGICGNQGTQTYCYNTGTVSGTGMNVGGICGDGKDPNTKITNCYNTGMVSGSSRVGGICGYYGTQTNCYNTGTVSGTNNMVGGICGYFGTQTNCYNTGTVSGTYRVGGICGYYGVQTNCYYLKGCAKDGNNVEQFGVGANKIGSTTADEEGMTISATDTEFASGKIGYLLNSGENTAWRQNLYTDALPSLDNSRNLASGYIAENENDLTVVGEVVSVTNYEVAEGKTLTIPEGASLTTTSEAVITNSGTIVCNSTISGNNLAGSGSFHYTLLADADVALNTTSYTYKGTAYTIEDGIDFSYATHTLCGKDFAYNGTPAVTYDANTNAGTANAATVTWNGTISRTFTINPKEVELVWGDTEFTYNGEAQAPTATATGMVNGEELTVTVSGAQTNAGTYTATASISDNNYKLPEVVTKEFTINNAAPTYVSETAANAVSIYAHQNIIVVKNANAEIRVYNAMGQLVCKDARPCVSTEIRVNGTGVYIVKTGNVAKRVMIND